MDRLAVGEHREKLLAVHARPVPDIADIHMHEGRTRTWIVADAADLHLQPDGPQLGEFHVRQVEIHRLAEHVLALLGDAVAAFAQHRVRRRRPVGGHDVDVVARARSAIDLPDEVEQPRIHLGRLVAAPVAQEAVDLLQAARNVASVALVGNLGLFLGMDEVELEATRLGGGRACAEKNDRQREHDAGEQSAPDRHATMPSPQFHLF